MAGCPKAAPPKLGPHHGVVEPSMFPSQVGAAWMFPVTGSARFLEYQLSPYVSLYKSITPSPFWSEALAAVYHLSFK